MKEVTIKQLALHLQKQIDIHLASFNEHYNQLKAINSEIEEIEKKTSSIFGL